MGIEFSLYNIYFLIFSFFNIGLNSENFLNFPIIIVWVIPPYWIILIPIYFLIYSFIGYFIFNLPNISHWKIFFKVILKSALFGLLTDALCVFLLIIKSIFLYVIQKSFFYNSEIYYKFMDSISNYNFLSFLKFEDIFLISTYIFISRIIFYKINMRFNIASLDIDGKNSDLAKDIAIYTAPYIFLLPNRILYMLFNLK